MSERSEGRRGSRFVLLMYASLVGVAGTLGFLTGLLIDGLRPPAYLFLLELPPTPAGMALYGALTVATVLGVPLALVIAVSRQLDDGARGGRED